MCLILMEDLKEHHNLDHGVSSLAEVLYDLKFVGISHLNIHMYTSVCVLICP